MGPGEWPVVVGRVPLEHTSGFCASVRASQGAVNRIRDRNGCPPRPAQGVLEAAAGRTDVHALRRILRSTKRRMLRRPMQQPRGRGCFGAIALSLRRIRHVANGQQHCVGASPTRPIAQGTAGAQTRAQGTRSCRPGWKPPLRGVGLLLISSHQARLRWPLPAPDASACPSLRIRRRAALLPRLPS